MDTQSVTPSTGLSATSTKVTLAAFLPGLAAIIASLAQNGSTLHSAITGVVGGVLMLGSVLGKLFHDRGIHVATITAAGSDVAKALPGLRTDLQSVENFVELEWPSTKAAFSEFSGLAHKAASTAEAARTAAETATNAVKNQIIPEAKTDVEAVRKILAEELNRVFSAVLPGEAAHAAAPVAPPVVIPVNDAPIV